MAKAPELSRFEIENVSVFETAPTGLGRVKLNTLLAPLVTIYHKLRNWGFLSTEIIVLLSKAFMEQSNGFPLSKSK